MCKSAMVVLAEAGLIRRGMEIEPVPQVLPAGYQPRHFRARVERPQGGQNSVRWQGELFSPSSLLNWLVDEYDVKYLPGVHNNWQIRGHSASLREEANKICPM